MSYREFRDSSGNQWEVWEVQPALLERRGITDRPVEVDRRMLARRRAPVADDLRFGWLVFQSGGSKRRLAPVPVGWERYSDEDLVALLERSSARDAPRIVLLPDGPDISSPVQSMSPG